MPEALTAGLPPDLTLSAGCQVSLTALDPTTGAFVAGVNLTGISFYVRDLIAGTTGDAFTAPVPLLVPTSETV